VKEFKISKEPGIFWRRWFFDFLRFQIPFLSACRIILDLWNQISRTFKFKPNFSG